MTILYRAAFVPLLCKSGSCIVKPQWTTRSTPSFKAYLQLVFVLRSFPKHFLGGPTTEGCCHIKRQPSEELTHHIKGRSPLLPATGPSFFLPLPSHRLLIIHTKQTRSSHSPHPQTFLHRSQTAASPTCQSPVAGRWGWSKMSYEHSAFDKSYDCFLNENKTKQSALTFKVSCYIQHSGMKVDLDLLLSLPVIATF